MSWAKAAAEAGLAGLTEREAARGALCEETFQRIALREHPLSIEAQSRCPFPLYSTLQGQVHTEKRGGCTGPGTKEAAGEEVAPWDTSSAGSLFFYANASTHGC